MMQMALTMIVSSRIAMHKSSARVGAPLDTCLREIVGIVRIQVVPAATDRPYKTLVTTGMSDYAMTAPAGAEDYRHIELFMHLPADWPLSQEAWNEPNHYWPIEWKQFGRPRRHTFSTESALLRPRLVSAASPLMGDKPTRYARRKFFSLTTTMAPSRRGQSRIIQTISARSMPRSRRRGGAHLKETPS